MKTLPLLRLARRLLRVDRAGSTVFVTTLVVFLVLSPQMTRRLNPVTGDEPFYLMTAISILEDQDLDEANNYAEADYHQFYPPNPRPSDWQGWASFPNPLPPHPTQSSRPGLYSKHGLGLTLLLLAPYALAGRIGVILMLNLAGALVAVNAYWLARRYLGQFGSAALALLVSLTVPLAPYAFLIFPGVPASVLITYSARRLLERPNSVGQWCLLSLSLSILPWFHLRFLPLVLVGTAVAILQLIRCAQIRSWLAWLSPMIGSASVYFGYLFWVHGSVTLPVRDHAGFNDLLGTINGTVGLLADGQWGLFVYAPFYALALALMPRFVARHRAESAILLALVSPYLLLVATYRVWWGEWCPPARYLVPVLPLAVAPIASWLAGVTRRGWGLVALLALPSLPATVIGFLDPQRLYHHPDGINKIYGMVWEWTSIPAEAFLVPFQSYTPAPVIERVAMGALVFGFLGVTMLVARWLEQITSPFKIT